MINTVIANQNKDSKVLKKIYHAVKEIDCKLNRGHKPLVINLANRVSANPCSEVTSFTAQENKNTQEAGSQSGFFEKLGLVASGAIALFIPMVYYMSKLKNKLSDIAKKEQLLLVTNNAKDIAVKTLGVVTNIRK